MSARRLGRRLPEGGLLWGAEQGAAVIVEDEAFEEEFSV